MDCTRRERPIVGDAHRDAVAVEHRGWLEDVMHFECVDDPAGLPPDQFARYAAWWMERERERRKAFLAQVDAELGMLHRAVHALPHHLNHAYIDEIYGGPEGSAREQGLIAGYCNTCGRPVFYTGERDGNCRPVLSGHASSCGALQVA